MNLFPIDEEPLPRKLTDTATLLGIVKRNAGRRRLLRLLQTGQLETGEFLARRLQASGIISLEDLHFVIETIELARRNGHAPVEFN